MFWVHVIQNPAGRFYIGHTAELEQRLRIIIELTRSQESSRARMGHGFCCGPNNIQIAQLLFNASAK
jgi:hypothetical protein